MRRRQIFACTALIAAGVLPTFLHAGRARADETITAPKLDPANTINLDVKAGRIVIALRPDLAPKMVARVKQLCHEHFYDGTPFHRVIDGFMAQGGDPTGTGEGGSKYPNVVAEFSQSAHFVRGSLGAARTSDPDTANSQFFIMFAPSEHLDGQYTIFGQVVSGMQYVDAIKKGDPESGAVTDPDKIIKMRVANDPS